MKRVVLGAFLFGLAGCGRSPEAPVAATSASQPVGAAVLDVQTTTAEQREIPRVILATGSFVADETSEVTPHVAGTIIETLANVGQYVRAGDVIVRLDDRDAQIRLTQIRATLQQAEAEAQRARMEMQRNADLAKSGDVSRNTYDRLTAQVAISEAAVAQVSAQLDAARKGVEDTIIRAPFSGHVSARGVSLGEYVTSSSKLISLVRIQPIKLNLQVPEADAARLRVGMPVQAEVPAHPDRHFAGTVAALNVALDPSSRSMTVEARFPNGDSALTPGMFGSAQIRLPDTETGVFVPASAVTAIANGESSGVFVVDGEVARVRVVQPGDTRDGARRILSGLDAGTVVITSQLDKLFDGARVRVAAGANRSAAITTPDHAQAR